MRVTEALLDLRFNTARLTIASTAKSREEGGVPVKRL